MENFESDITNQIIDKQVKQFDAEIFGALKKHGYDVNYNNMHEFAKNHRMEQTIHDGLNTLLVDGKGICIWTEWEIETFDFTKELKINSSFRFQIL